MELRFLMNFRLLQTYLQEAFSKLFGGGKAELRLTDEGDVLGSGIEIAAQPPGKKLQLLSLLSGGERALTAIAILFAMLKLKPTPFCFLDEIEAALDDGNIETFARYLQDFSKNTQFVIISSRLPRRTGNFSRKYAKVSNEFARRVSGSREGAARDQISFPR